MPSGNPARAVHAGLHPSCARMHRPARRRQRHRPATCAQARRADRMAPFFKPARNAERAQKPPDPADRSQGRCPGRRSFRRVGARQNVRPPHRRLCLPCKREDGAHKPPGRCRLPHPHNTLQRTGPGRFCRALATPRLPQPPHATPSRRVLARPAVGRPRSFKQGFCARRTKLKPCFSPLLPHRRGSGVFRRVVVRQTQKYPGGRAALYRRDGLCSKICRVSRLRTRPCPTRDTPPFTWTSGLCSSRCAWAQ